ncbi:aspartate aminotransferase family protein [Terriglobus sp.]|uniref:aspartate aminotransferase family protein n=1 Tax=Terriglobus sp. TaxID=1889013 RepID=UPI003AFFA720
MDTRLPLLDFTNANQNRTESMIVKQEIGGATNMNLVATQAAEQKLLLSTYDRHPILFTRGDGVHLYDDAGTPYLDLLSGIGVCGLGYNHPAINRAITAQLSTGLLHTSNLFFHNHTATLALKLTEITGMDRVFLCNSGTEAWEAALKLARAHAELLRKEGKRIGTRVLALEHSFHGRTMGSVATTHKHKYREPFQPVMPGVSFVPFNDVDALRAAFNEDICAICIEPLQGEGGIHPVSQEFFEVARALCDATGALLLADEIQSGMGRTGKWCAYQHYGIQPDVTTLAKPIAGGLPMGAMCCNEEAARAITPGMHGTTFGGGPLVCAVALAVIDEIERSSLLNHVAEVGSYFKQRLESLAAEHAAVAEVRGMGLMLGMDMHSDKVAAELQTRMMLEKHILLNRTSETVLRFLPPFLITRAQVDETIAAMESLIEEIETKQAAVAEPAGEAVHG